MPADLLDVVRAGPAVTDLRAYFDGSAPRLYTGRRFEALAGGGDRLDVRDVIAADDLVAVQLLSVVVPAEVAIDLLDGGLGPRMAELLSEIPADVELGTERALGLVADGMHADRAWHLLERQHGVGFVIAGKVLARKRPHLIPVYDQVIACLFGEPDHVWLRLHHRLAADRGALRDELALLRARTRIPANVSLLRVLDVVLWMSHHDEHRSGACPGFGSVVLS